MYIKGRLWNYVNKNYMINKYKLGKDVNIMWKLWEREREREEYQVIITNEGKGKWCFYILYVWYYVYNENDNNDGWYIRHVQA